jgi:hypothetical protein
LQPDAFQDSELPPRNIPYRVDTTRSQAAPEVRANIIHDVLHALVDLAREYHETLMRLDREMSRALRYLDAHADRAPDRPT